MRGFIFLLLILKFRRTLQVIGFLDDNKILLEQKPEK